MDATTRERLEDIDRMVSDIAGQRDELVEALEGLVGIVDAAGLLHLSNGVEVGQTSWYVKATDRMEAARAALARARGETP